ncbi:DUF3465 domain-containing protein [Acinetobacter sp.]|uniref:DUF3465 domain-containing protein n=1 Tax=Acinetobacter sp. TaxID=472 RepID=UPI002FCA4075
MVTNKTNMAIGAVIVVLVAAYFGLDLKQQQTSSDSPLADSKSHAEVSVASGHPKVHVDTKPSSLQTQDDEKIQQAFQEQRSNIQVQSRGLIKAILRDDNNGSRHQKIILELSTGQTVLVAHNIDLAPRIENLKQGEIVEFNGEYEYSPQGGVIHWTHHDPQNKHVGGWLKYKGQIYQ